MLYFIMSTVVTSLTSTFYLCLLSICSVLCEAAAATPETPSEINKVLDYMTFHFGKTVNLLKRSEMKHLDLHVC